MKSIQEAIKQEKFDSNYHMSYINLMYTANHFTQIAKQVFGPYDLKQQHYNVLRIIKGRNDKPITPGEILEVMLDSSPDLTRLLDKLVKQNLIRRETPKKNKRKRLVYLTEFGKKTLIELTTKINSRIFNNPTIDESDALKLSLLLDQMRG